MPETLSKSTPPLNKFSQMGGESYFPIYLVVTTGSQLAITPLVAPPGG